MLSSTQEIILVNVFDKGKSKEENIKNLIRSYAKNELKISNKKIFDNDISQLVYELNGMDHTEYENTISKLFRG